MLHAETMTGMGVLSSFPVVPDMKGLDNPGIRVSLSSAGCYLPEMTAGIISIGMRLPFVLIDIAEEYTGMGRKKDQPVYCEDLLKNHMEINHDLLSMIGGAL
ncbi:MAG: hypothetical protein ABIH89_01500 [Elusimicrobiota bacterium]